ncbi:hypothetical protein A2376_01805 [Candidatus Woesebacteria bacterium RIFOXYB1_FULL_47_31]|nr:MAG: hypothetical protein A2376_01805 [Candidatus Woesebacteria bacterium RIFOXYB1_FULL_47_31]OGM90008.1 MAG: hypothetical protein A2597_01185 [Candidatus Woesebacteria bacterium RIFOXYD1_FULL_46_19]
MPKMKKNNSKNDYFLEVGNFVIKIELFPTENIIIKNLLRREIEKVWGGGKFLSKRAKASDWIIRIFPAEKGTKIIHQKFSGESYILTYKRNGRKFTTFYHVSFYSLQMFVKEILDSLLANDGFILHASSVIDKMGVAHVFLAPREGGKSTIGKLLGKRGFSRLSDDNLITRKLKSAWNFFSPPFVEKDLLPLKKEAEKARIYFLKKSKKAQLTPLKNRKKILKKVLQNVWVNRGVFEKAKLKNIMDFASNNNFYLLKSTLNVNEMQKIINEN